MERQLTKAWYDEHARPSLLQPLSFLYGVLLALRRRAYARGWLHSQRVGTPLIVVGNLTVGGTGKTPLTVWLAHQLGAAGLRVGIVSRGYGARGGEGPREVEPGSSWCEVGDEPLILARRSACPTVVARDRVAAARTLCGRVDVIVADDGLQHLALARDVQIVVIDGLRGFGNGRLLPAGPLREPLARLAEADAIVVNGAPEHASLRGLPAGALGMNLEGEEAVSLGGLEPARTLGSFAGQDVHAVAGIGNPARFFAALRAHGLKVREHAFPDHHPLSMAELAFGDGLPVLMTEKDAVKLAPVSEPRLWYVPVTARLSELHSRELLARVLAKVRGAGA